MPNVVSEGPLPLDGGWVLVDTDMIAELLLAGKRVELPHVESPDASILQFYSESDRACLDLDVALDEIESVEYVGEMPVQCISIEDEDHLYLTDSFVPSHNTSNIVFLKSTDDAMIDTLEKMSGKTHRAYGDSKMVTRNLARVFMRNEDTSSLTISVREEPVIKYNDMAFINERNSIVFRAGDPPIWNRNELVLPMSWRLFLNKIEHPGRDYSLQTIPTLSSAIDFDVRKNQPDFESMVTKRLGQAVYAREAMKAFRDVFGYNDYEVEQIDPDIYADSVMDIIAARLNSAQGRDADAYEEHVDAEALFGSSMPHTELNRDQVDEANRQMKANEAFSKKRYAGGLIARDDLAQFDEGGRTLSISHALDQIIIDVFRSRMSMFERDRANFMVRNKELLSANGRQVYIARAKRLTDDESRALVSGMYARDVPVYSEDRIDTEEVVGYVVSDDFYRFLVSLDSWDSLAGGAFNSAIRKVLMAP